jgi:hypothetical protein
MSVNDHEMIVSTDQGEQAPLELDSHTMAPRDLAPGMVMRAEFVALDDCRFYAQRVMPLRGGMSPNRSQAYANTRETHDAMANDGSLLGGSITTPASAEGRESPQSLSDYSPGTMIASPTTAAYQFSTRPMLSGRVITVNDHRMLVVTDQGSRSAWSWTHAPWCLAKSCPARLCVRNSGECGTVATTRGGRVMQTGVVDREQAYAHTQDTDLALASNSSDCGFANVSTANPATSSLEPRDVRPEPVAQTVQSPVDERPQTLPETASNQPLILLLALSAFVAAGALIVVRGLRVV